ncbi:MAG: sugar phosphate isomerase/epimerase [Bacteroidota bacterium]|nr:sugar phosphate isomerase/epimerase [Bacteroidota bacterium]
MENKLSRRKFLNSAAAVAALSVIPFNYGFKSFMAGSRTVKPNSKFGGVQIGAITYSWRSMPGTPNDIINYCIQAGISDLELMGNVAEDYLGIPQSPARPPRGADQTKEQTEAYEKAAAAATEAQRKWRLALPMQKYTDLRKMFNDAGINIHIIKFSPANWTDEEIDYAFNAAKAIGAKGVTNEIGDEACKRLGPFAEKHEMYAIFHQHGQPGEPGWNFDQFLAYSPNNMLNFDAGHYFGSTGLHPNEIIKRLHNRIVSIHMKDKTGPKSTPPNTNQVWGKGEMPIADVLLLLKKEKWPIYVDVELEYEVPTGSDAAKEVGKCVEYAKAILTK